MAGGNNQRDYISKEYSSSPTLATEALLLFCIIDSEEEKDVDAIDTPSAFIQKHADNENEMVVIKIRGVQVDLLLKIYPDFYGPFLTTYKKGENVLIVQCMNAIYGTMEASLIY